MTLKDKITNILKLCNGGWVASYEFICKDTIYGWIGSSGDRRARELVAEGVLERKHDGKYAWYRIKPKQLNIF
jgi:hypothetical protein